MGGSSGRATDTTSLQRQCTMQCSRGCGICPTGRPGYAGAAGEPVAQLHGAGHLRAGHALRLHPSGEECQPACQSLGGGSSCPVGQRCCTSAGLGQLCPYVGECFTPHGDGGCSLCTPPDGRQPITPNPKDAGSGNGGSGGCGCAEFGPASSLAMLGVLGLASRRRSWLRR